MTQIELESVFASLNSRKLKTVIEGMQILRDLFGSGVVETAIGSGKDDNDGRGNGAKQNRARRV